MNTYYNLAKPKQPEHTPPHPIDVPNPDQEEDLPNQEPIDVPLDDEVPNQTQSQIPEQLPGKDRLGHIKRHA